MTKSSKSLTPNKFIATVRESFLDAEYVYTHGGCYTFFLILKQVFPDAVPYYHDEEGHVYTKIDESFYDIRGRHVLNEKAISCMYERPELMRDVHRWMPRMNNLRVVGALQE